MTHVASITAPGPRSAADIAAELRRDFARLLAARYGTAALPDPVLATLFHAFAERIGAVYEEAEQLFPEAVLDDIVAGLDMPPRLALPAQAVVSFSRVSRRERVGEDVQLNGYLKTGARVCFAPDVPIEIAPTTLVFAAVSERGRLHSIPGARLPDDSEVPPGSVPLASGDAPPAIYLALHTDAAHLSALGLYIDAGPTGGDVADALGRASWHVLDRDGRVSARSALRASKGRGGVQRLEWVDTAGSEAVSAEASIARNNTPDRGAWMTQTFSLYDGVYGRQVWVFPSIPEHRRCWSGPPPAIASAISQLLPADFGDVLDGPAAWVQIALPPDVIGVANAIQQVAVNCVTVSNVEVMSERLTFDRMGMAVVLSPEEDHDRHLLGVLSVVGESGASYVDQHDLAASPASGRYHCRHGVLDVHPAQRPSGRYDGYAMVHLLYCDGARANGVDIGDLCTSNSKLANLTASVRNLTVSRGGAAPPSYADARTRFAEALRTRERIVTAADVDVSARAFEPRIDRVDVVATCDRTSSGLRPVDLVTIHVRHGEFADPEADLVRLRDRLERHLQQRAMIGHRIRVAIGEEG
jgi:hypothetical protein